MSSLYELSQEYQQLLAMDAEDDEAFREALDETLAAQGEQWEEKVEATVIVARQLQADAEACKAEARRLSERAKQFERNAETCRERVRLSMEDLGKDKVKRQFFTITRVAGKPVCAIDDETALPSDYIRIKEVRSPDKAELLKALKAGEQIPGCHLASGKDSLRIS